MEKLCNVIHSLALWHLHYCEAQHTLILSSNIAIYNRVLIFIDARYKHEECQLSLLGWFEFSKWLMSKSSDSINGATHIAGQPEGLIAWEWRKDVPLELLLQMRPRSVVEGSFEYERSLLMFLRSVDILNPLSGPLVLILRRVRKIAKNDY